MSGGYVHNPSDLTTIEDYLGSKVYGLSALAAILASHGIQLESIDGDVAGLDGDAMRGTDDATLQATWTDAMATALANYTAVRAGYIDQLDFDLQEDIATIDTATSVISTDIVGTNAAYMHNPLVDQANIVVTQIGLIRNKPSAAAIQIAEITTPGLIKVWRYRKGTDDDWNLIVAGGGMGAGVGSIYYQYTFPSASWADGDLILYEVYNTVVTLDTEVFTLSTVQGFGVIGDTTQTAAILADTNELQADWANDGRLDNLLDAITAAGPTNAQMETARDAIIAEVDANETKIDAITAAGPTNAQMDSAIATVIADTEDIQSILGTPANFMADVSGITAAGPTKGEMDTAHALLATEAKQDIIDTNVDQIEALVAKTVEGKLQMHKYETDLDSCTAGSWATETAVGGSLIIEGIVCYCHRDMTSEGSFTGFSVETDADTPYELISQADGVVANMGAESQITWSGRMLLVPGTYLQFTTYGGTISSVESLWDWYIMFRAFDDGSYIA